MVWPCGIVCLPYLRGESRHGFREVSPASSSGRATSKKAIEQIFQLLISVRSRVRVCEARRNRGLVSAVACGGGNAARSTVVCTGLRGQCFAACCRNTRGSAVGSLARRAKSVLLQEDIRRFIPRTCVPPCSASATMPMRGPLFTDVSDASGWREVFHRL